MTRPRGPLLIDSFQRALDQVLSEPVPISPETVLQRAHGILPPRYP